MNPYRILPMPRAPSASWLWVALLLLAASCGASQVSTEARVANAVGVSANASEPLWIAEYRRDGEAAADSACPLSSEMAPACVASRVAAAAPVEARWSQVHNAWNVLRRAHGAYALALDDCQSQLADGGTCQPLTAASVAFDDAVLAFRCALRAIGQSRLDPLPGAPTCGGAL